ncbi:heat-shock protein Hsp20 [archaeon SCG-AAA382B04]|nr:heat-shock protein Hsp20 [archaeon SCG-AAA382B04]
MTRRDDPFDELFKKMLEDFFGETPGQRGMGGLFGELDDIFNKIDRENFREALNEKKEYSNDQPFRFGFSIRRGPSGETEINTFGDDVEKEEREPLVDVFEEEDRIKVIAEIPGAREKDIEFDVSGKKLVISAEGDSNRYSKEVELPKKVDVDSVEKQYTNGVLSLEFEAK